MSIGIYQSAASLTALERWQEVVTQNITSSQVPGFKRRTVQIDGVPAGELRTNAPGQEAQSRAALFPALSFGISFTSGEAQPTRRELDFAISGEGFFNVRLPDGTTGYTRAGQLQIRADRTIVTSQGLEVLGSGGQALQLSAEGGPLTADEAGNLRQGDVAIGQLALTRFNDMTRLLSSSGGIFVAGDEAGAEPVEAPIILQGHVEASNAKPLHEMVDLVNIARAYEANQKIIQNRDQMLQRVLDSVG